MAIGSLKQTQLFLLKLMTLLGLSLATIVGSAQKINGSISLRSTPFFAIPCDGPNSNSKIKLWSEIPQNEKGESNQKAVESEVSCGDVEKLDAKNGVIFMKDKVSKNGFVKIGYTVKGQAKEAWVNADDYTTYDSLCDYAFQKNEFLRDLERINQQNAKDAYENLKAETATKLKQFDAFASQRHELQCTQDQPYGIFGKQSLDMQKPAELPSPPDFSKPEDKDKQCVYTHEKLFSAKNSGVEIAKRISTSKNPVEEYIKIFGGVALKIEQVHGIPAELFLAKIQLEATSGTSQLFRQNNNFGGIGYLSGGNFNTEVMGLDGQKRTIYVGRSSGYFNFGSVKDAIDYYAHMMLYQPETAGVYNSFRNSICSAANMKSEQQKTKAADGASAALLLGNYSELGAAYNNQMANHIRTRDDIKNFKKKHMLCDGEESVHQ